MASFQQHLLGSRLPCDKTESSEHFGCLPGKGLTISPQKSYWGLNFVSHCPFIRSGAEIGPLIWLKLAGLLFRRRHEDSLNEKEIIMTFFSTPMARQFVGFDTLFEELNAFADRKEPNYPAYNIAKDDDEHYRIEVALAGFSQKEINIQTEKGILTMRPTKPRSMGFYPSRHCQRAFLKCSG